MAHAHQHLHISDHELPRADKRRPEGYANRKHPEFVVLEIGENLGALILHTDADMHGVEVEISPDHDDHDRDHKQVLERSTNGRPAFTAVFDGLPAGRYALWTNGRARARGVAIEGGSIAQLDWRTSVAERGVGSSHAPAASEPPVPLPTAVPGAP